jgi:hypothetical protein
MKDSANVKDSGSWTGFWSYMFWAFVAYWAIYAAWHSNFAYSVRYSVSYDQVTQQKKPHNCEFLSAPIGDKNCHYDPEVQSVRTATSDLGTPIMSYDDGKTWVPNEWNVKPGVSVSWVKVDE